MPAFGTAKIVAQVERDATPCIPVALDGTEAPLDFLEVLSIRDAKGANPGRAICRVSHETGVDNAVQLPSPQDAYYGPKNFKGWSRIKFTHDGEICFIGNLVNRIERGEKNHIQLTFVSDLAFLAKIPVRGCLVRDPYTEEVRFVPGYDPTMNPKGYNNCTKAVVSGVDGDAYVYTPFAFANAAGAWSDSTGDDAAAGTSIPWTSERALNYWCLYSTFGALAAAGILDAYPEFVTLDTSKLEFPMPVMTDPLMKKKLPEMGFKGMRVLGAIHKVLEATNIFDIGVAFQGNVSIVDWKPRTMTYNGVTYSGIDVPVQVAGAVMDLKSIFDFELESDYMDLATGVVYEGDTVKIESEWEYDPAAEDASPLRKAWTSTDQTNHRDIIVGNGTHAKGPLTPADINTPANWVLMDGSGGRPTILAKTVAAMKLARQCFPKVWRAYKLQGDSSTAGGATLVARLGGVASKFDAVEPLGINRGVDDVQLEPFFEADATNENNRGYLRWPARITVRTSASATTWHDVEYNNALRVEDGLIYLDGLTDDQAGDDNIYSGSLAADPANVTARAIRINAYINHDCRIKAHRDIFWENSSDPNKIKDEVNPNISKKGNRFGFQHYVLTPEGFREEHQMSSRPIGTTAKANTVLHTDDTQIGAAADRKIAEVAKVKKRQVWWVPGIRTEFRAGMLLGSVVLYGASGAAGKHSVDKPLDAVVWDFEHQRTGLYPDN